MQRGHIVGGLALMGAGAAAILAWWPSAATAPTAGPAAPTSAPASAKASVAPTPSPRTEPDGAAADAEAHAKWARARDRIRAAHAERVDDDDDVLDTEGAPSLAGDEHCDEACWGNLQLSLRLGAVADGCRDTLPPSAVGRARFEARIIAEPGVGAVIESVEVVDDAIGSTAFAECIVESALVVGLGDAAEPVADTVPFRFTAGPPADNAGDFLRDHPEVTAAHPELSSILERAVDAPRSDDDATAFAHVVGSDPDAMAAFSQWVAEQGVDLSAVRVEG